MPANSESYPCEQDPLLLSLVEGGLDNRQNDLSAPVHSNLANFEDDSNEVAERSDDLTTTDMLLAYADNVTEVIAEVVYDVAGEVQHVVMDVAGDLQHTLEEMVTPEGHSLPEGETIHLAVARTASFLPGDVPRAPAAAEPTILQQYQTFETASLTDAETIESGSSRGLEVIEERKSDFRLSSPGENDNFVVEDPKDLIGISKDVSVNTEESYGPPFVAYLLLAAAVIGLSSIGPLLNVQSGVDDTIKTLWRNSATACALFPLALRSIFVDGFPSLSLSQGVVLVLTGACYALYTVLFAWAVQYTTIGNAVIFSNTQAIILLIGKTIMGEPLSLLEAVGSITAFGGAVLCSRDSAQGEDVDFSKTSLWGDGIAMLCAFCGVGYLVTAKTIRPVMNLYVFMCCIMFWASVGSLLLAYMVGIPVTLDRHVDHGAFGWMNWETDRLPLEVIMVVSCQFFGALGYIRCMHYFSNLVISVATLMEPVVAEMTAVALGVGSLPGWMGWVGNGLVIVGTLAVVYRPSSKEASHV